MENSIEAFRFESETLVETQKQEMNNKRVKMGVILILCLLLLNFVLVVVVMNRTSELSSSSSTCNFSAAVNQMLPTGETENEMKFELGGIEKWINSTAEKLEIHQAQIEALLNQTETDKKFEALENQNRQLEKTLEDLKEQFESLSQKLDQLENNTSSACAVQLLAPPESRGPPKKNADQQPIDSSVDIHPQSLKSCSDAQKILPSPRSARQTIYPHGNSTSVEFLCDFETEGGGWTIIQKRTSGPKNEFNHFWNDYVKGFGSLEKNFWLGLANIRALTQNGDQELRIQLEGFYGEEGYAKYSNFSISDAVDFYRLSISGFSGTVPNAMDHGPLRTSNGMRFSTRDKDHDEWDSKNVAVEYGGGGGWWFNLWIVSNLNGLYYEEEETITHNDGIYWYQWNLNSMYIAKSEMKIRTRKS